MHDQLSALVAWLAPILSTIIVAFATAKINSSVKKHEQLADERHAETEAKRKTEAEWRASVDKILSEQSNALKSVAEDRVDWYAWRAEIVKLINDQDERADQQGDALKSVAEDRIDWYAWRAEIVKLINNQDERMMSMLKAQCTQMRTDTLHRVHRYLDDLGCASTEEKNAFWAEYSEYCELCEKYGIKNEFVDELAKRVMALPEREI